MATYTAGDCCCSTSTCCPERQLPTRLYAHFTGGVGDCVCADGVVGVMDGAVNLWFGTIDLCGSSPGPGVNLICNIMTGIWTLSGEGGIGACSFSAFSKTADFISCDPLQLIFNNIQMGGCCTGTTTVVILETP